MSLSTFGRKQAQLLEIAGLMTAAQHYKVAGYSVIPRRLSEERVFRLKINTNSDPRRYSHFEICRHAGEGLFEVHGNLPVSGHYSVDGGRYVVDVAVIKAGRMPVWQGQSSKIATDDLVTFSEVKNLVTYPMLLAQFIGIVHEILPQFLTGRTPWGFRRDKHFFPALITVGGLRATSRDVVSAYPERGYRVKICDSLDRVIAERGWRNLTISPLQ